MINLTFITGMERFNAHLWSDVERRLRAGGVDVRIMRFHDGHVEQRDPALARAIAGADVLFITLINMRDQAAWLAEQLARSRAKTVFAFESMPEVMELTRVGEYRVAGGKSALPKPMQMILKLITRGRDEDTLYAYTKLTKISAKLLPLMPAKLKDFRTWLSVNLYWNQPDAPNLTEMVRLILRDCLGQPLEVAPVRPIPMMGCFHPDADELFADPHAFLKWYSRRKAKDQRPKTKGANPSPDRPLVALLAFRKHVVQGLSYLGDLIRELEGQGLAVLPIFVSGIEAHVAVREWIARERIDLLISTMGFPLVGGPAGSTKPGQYHEKASDLLAAIDVPYMIVQPLQMQDERHWRANGVAPMQAVIMYDLPEMDGSIAPVVIGAISGQEIVATPDRLARAARQAAGWVSLRRKPPAERRVALVLYNYPPGLGKLGTAALLDVPASLHALLGRLSGEGYTVTGAPASPAELARRIGALENHDADLPRLGARGVPVGDSYALALADYRRIVPPAAAARVDRYWGSPPGDIAPLGPDAIRIDGFELGNLFVGVQPPMGVPGDPMRLLFEHDFTPHHQYVGFYRWLREVWRADAIVHVGMHGTAEWMPGLQLGLTAECWPDVLLGELPNLYLYPLNNPSEAGIAKRRGYATIVSHAVPPYARAGLYKQLAQTRAALEAGAASACPELPDLPRGADEPDDSYRARLSAYLDELEQRLILDGLHVFGGVPAPERAAALVEAALDVPRDGAPGLAGLLAAAGVAPADIPRARAEFVRRFVLDQRPMTKDEKSQPATTARPSWESALSSLVVRPSSAALIAHGKLLLQRMAESDELGALVRALAGGYVRPAFGADPVRAGAGALPSGRNIHGIDPWRLPSDAALARGDQAADLLLRRHQDEHGALPQTVAQTLWAMDTIKNEGESLAVVLALAGARPERDGQGKIWRYELIPPAELGRPRVDVLLNISPIFRDTFQMSLDLVDDLFRRIAAADEPPEQNFIRAHTLDLQAQGHSWEQATARIFTQAPGRYGTGVDELIDESAWETRDELAETYLQRGGYTYGGDRHGAAAPELLRGLLGTVDHVFQAIDSVEYGLTDMQHYYGHSGALQMAAERERGASVPLSYAESYTGGVKIASAAELLRVEARSKLLNPRWYEGMLSHGYAGAAEIGSRFTYLLGWSAVSDVVAPWVFDEAAATFVLDETMRRRLEQANPQAARNAVSRLLEANDRGLWHADEATLAALQEIYGDMEDRLEGVALSDKVTR
ncbi:MAG: magnesium chelatase subunit H [Kouleothrix sp.]|nr:magnesium chelatase subunit H [Kouleothrix sp.]